MVNTEHKHIGILGGTFDPVHIAHLRLALDLKISTNISEIRLMPNFIPPHKNMQVTNIEHRLNMLELATKNLKDITIDKTEIEIAKEKLKTNNNYRSYMTDTLDVLNNKYSKLYKDKYTIWLILGADSFASLNTWHMWESILNKTNFLILKRDNQEISCSNNWMDALKSKIIIDKQIQQINQHQLPCDIKSGYIYIKNSRQLQISATEIRHLISTNQPCDFLIIDSVRKYIQENKIYN